MLLFLTVVGVGGALSVILLAWVFMRALISILVTDAAEGWVDG